MTILQRIVEAKRAQVEAAKRRRALEELRGEVERFEPPRGFAQAVFSSATDRLASRSPTEVRLIAEIKQFSPSAGMIVPDFDPVRIAKTYADHGAAALSVLTDEAFFGGRLEFIRAVKDIVPLPVLRKDFLIDEYQVFESRVAGADAVLLIAEVLSDEQLGSLLAAARAIALDVLVEVHSENNLHRVLAALGPPMSATDPSGRAAYLLGINNRDLSAQRVDLQTMSRLAAQLPAGAPFVAESGIATHADVREALRCGARAVLVGEALLRAPDIGAAVATLLGRVP